jgi:hypothetical protein
MQEEVRKRGFNSIALTKLLTVPSTAKRTGLESESHQKELKKD